MHIKIKNIDYFLWGIVIIILIIMFIIRVNYYKFGFLTSIKILIPLLVVEFIIICYIVSKKFKKIEEKEKKEMGKLYSGKRVKEKTRKEDKNFSKEVNKNFLIVIFGIFGFILFLLIMFIDFFVAIALLSTTIIISSIVNLITKKMQLPNYTIITTEKNRNLFYTYLSIKMFIGILFLVYSLLNIFD